MGGNKEQNVIPRMVAMHYVQRNAYLVKTLALETLAEHLANAGQVGDRLVAHRLRDEVLVFRGRRRHGAGVQNFRVRK